MRQKGSLREKEGSAVLDAGGKRKKEKNQRGSSAGCNWFAGTEARFGCSNCESRSHSPDTARLILRPARTRDAGKLKKRLRLYWREVLRRDDRAACQQSCERESSDLHEILVRAFPKKVFSFEAREFSLADTKGVHHSSTSYGFFFQSLLRAV